MPAREGASVREQRKKEARTWRLVETPNSSRSVRTLQTALHAKAFRGRRHDLVESRVRETRTPGSMSGERKRGYGGD